MSKPPAPGAPDIVQRKSDHIDVVMHQDVGFGALSSGFERIRFVHNALPDLALDEIDLSTTFLRRRLQAPFLISSMTGGPDRAETINIHLTEAAEALGIAMAVGSQRVALEEKGAWGLTGDLRQRAPTVPLIGNLGAAQILGPTGVDRARRALDMIKGDGLFIHLNPLQESVQSGGDTDWRGVLGAIEALVKADIPIIVKEVGFGLSAGVIQSLYGVGVSMVDVAGAGGTNWARVEGVRGTDPQNAAIAAAFTEWGIPTAAAVADARTVCPQMVVIASGGIANGVDAAKAIRLGADLVGQAAGVLDAATQSTQAVVDHFRTLIEALRVACFCTGSADLKALRAADLQAS